MVKTAANAEPIDTKKVLAALQQLYDALNRAYWVATTIETKDRLHGLAEAVFNLITDINRIDIGSHTKEYERFCADVAKVKRRLESLQDDIDKIIHAVDVATQLAKSVEKALPLLALFAA